MTTSSTGQIVTSVAVDTLKTLLPTIIGATTQSMSPAAAALLTLLPAFVQAAETISATNGATSEQLMTMLATVNMSIQSEHDEFLARQAARAAAAPVPATVANQAA